MFRMLSRRAIPALTAIFLAAAAQAAPVNVTAISGVWSATGPIAAEGLGSSMIQWGTPAEPGVGKSAYEFLAAPTPMNNLAADNAFSLGTFTHFNNPIHGPSLNAATLDVSISILIGSTEHHINTAFRFSHLESRNAAATCANGAANGIGVNANGCGDRVIAEQNNGMSESIFVGDDEYVMLIEGFMVGDTLMDEFWTKEEAENSAVLQGRFVLRNCVTNSAACNPPSVPLPAAGWLLVTGLAAVAAFSRRRQA